MILQIKKPSEVARQHRTELSIHTYIIHYGTLRVALKSNLRTPPDPHQANFADGIRRRRITISQAQIKKCQIFVKN